MRYLSLPTTTYNNHFPPVCQASGARFHLIATHLSTARLACRLPFAVHLRLEFDLGELLWFLFNDHYALSKSHYRCDWLWSFAA